MLDNFADGVIDKLFMVSNEFVNTMTQEAKVEQLLPLQAEDPMNSSITGIISMSPMLKLCWKVCCQVYRVTGLSGGC